MNELPKRILIVGLGLMGGSYAKALSQKGFEIHAISLEQQEIEAAKKEGCIQEGRTSFDAKYLANFPLIVFALYPEVLISWLKQNATKLKAGTLLTDVTGVKQAIIDQVEETIQGTGCDFVFAHPMAGRESKGFAHADASIFAKANFLVVPIEGNKEEHIALIEELGKALGCRRIVRISPKQHDEMIAYVSQLTHLIAIALMDAKDNTHLAEFTGDSFRDLTRISQINEDMWSSLFLLNKEELLKQMDLFIKEMGMLRSAIAGDDTKTLKEKMRESSARRAKFTAIEEERK